jgi:hypothetical protein
MCSSFSILLGWQIMQRYRLSIASQDHRGSEDQTLSSYNQSIYLKLGLKVQTFLQENLPQILIIYQEVID